MLCNTLDNFQDGRPDGAVVFVLLGVVNSALMVRVGGSRGGSGTVLVFWIGH